MFNWAWGCHIISGEFTNKLIRHHVTSHGLCNYSSLATSIFLHSFRRLSLVSVLLCVLLFLYKVDKSTPAFHSKPYWSVYRYRHFWPLVNWMLEFYGKVNILRSHFKFPKIINDEMPLIHIDNFFNSYSLISFMLFQFFIYIHQRQPSASLAVTVYFTPIRMYL